MTKEQRAAQLWPLLAWVASQKQTITYGSISALIGVPSGGLGHLLEPIQSYCLLRNIPPLTVVVVSKETGLPGGGFVGDQFQRGLERTYGHDWLEERSPTPEQFAEAVRSLPSNGNETLRPG